MLASRKVYIFTKYQPCYFIVMFLFDQESPHFLSTFGKGGVLFNIAGASHIVTTPLLQSTSLVTPSHISTSAVTPLLITPPLVTPIPITPSVVDETPKASSDSAIRATSERLHAAVEAAKEESKR